MITLAIETATAACSVALLRDGSPLAPTLLGHTHEVVGRGHAERLVPMIGEVMNRAGVDRADRILVDCGPGSFTGIRVGLAAARALGLAWGAEVAGFSALALLAAAHGEGEPCAAALTGGHGELFVQRFAGGPVRPLDELRSLTPRAAADAVPDLLVIGTGATALVAARGTGRAIDELPVAAEVGRLPFALAALAPRPLYGRAPDAGTPR